MAVSKKIPDDFKPPYFDEAYLPQPSEAYVAWLDVMGVRATMLRSVRVTANFVFKLHVAALEASGNLDLYPVMDGVFIVAEDGAKMRSFLSEVFGRLSAAFIRDPPKHRFLVKCSVAFGDVIHGQDVKDDATKIFKTQQWYKEAILLGMPMVFAVQSEFRAPPFGVFVHDSARRFLKKEEQARSHVWWPWFQSAKEKAAAQALKKALPDYFNWCEKRAGAIDYDSQRIRLHREQSEQYFVDV